MRVASPLSEKILRFPHGEQKTLTDAAASSPSALGITSPPHGRLLLAGW
jgi:hypothetical protein